MKLKQASLILGAVMVAVASFADPVAISFTGTALGDRLAYEIGNSYTFNVVISDNYTGGNGDMFAPSVNYWLATNDTSTSSMLQDFSGGNTSGTFTPASFPKLESMVAGNSEGMDVCQLTVNMEYHESGVMFPTDYSTGSPESGLELSSVQLTWYLPTGTLDYSDTSFVNPASWLSANATALSSNFTTCQIGLSGYNTNVYMNQFSVTDVTVSPVPEPATAGLLAISGLVLVGCRRMRKFYGM